MLLGIFLVCIWLSVCILIKLVRWYMYIFFFSGGRLYIDDLSFEIWFWGFYIWYFCIKSLIFGIWIVVGIFDLLIIGKYFNKNKWIIMCLFVNYCLKNWNIYKFGIGF